MDDAERDGVLTAVECNGVCQAHPIGYMPMSALALRAVSSNRALHAEPSRPSRASRLSGRECRRAPHRVRVGRS